TIEPLESNTVYTEVKLKDAGSFFERALVEVEDANVEKVELINESTLGITFDFDIREDINVMVSDSENHVGRGGTVLLETIDPTGASEREEEVYDAYSISKSGGGYSYRLTATPEEGYTFKGWYKGNSGWMDDEENPLPAYDRDSLISAETSYSYEVTWGGDVCFCAVFEEGGGIALNKTAAKILVGKTLQLKATPADAGLKWATDEPEIASVSKTGLVTAHYPGTARIQVSAANGASAICTVTVTFRYVYQCEKNGVYRYTTNVKLARELKAAGWTAAKVLRAPGLSKTKVYWVYNKSTKRYRWTTDLAYAKKMKNAGNKAGLAFYSADVKTVPVYELQKGKTYFYTMKKSVAKSMKNSGWTYVGIAWYAQPT
ncbi:MAG: Ig-like domain-containing protein, partial [Lachnospiraceae bacterium]